MKKFLLVFYSFYSSFAFSQNVSEYSLSKEEEILYFHVKDYIQSSSGLKIEKNYQLDSISNLRASYFLSLIKEARKNNTLSEIQAQIPKDKTAHLRNFGNPIFFKEPVGIAFPERFTVLPNKKIKIKTEIMQQIVYYLIEEDISDNEVIRRALRYLKKMDGNDFILNSYKKSIYHNMAILDYKYSVVGVSIRVLVSRKMTQGNKWRYEVLFYNVVSFGQVYKNLSKRN
jgi:hypothetical protein